VGYGPNSDSAAAAAAVAKMNCESSCRETDADGQTDKIDNVVTAYRNNNKEVVIML